MARQASAFAAEIGTMRVTEELDALERLWVAHPAAAALASGASLGCPELADLAAAYCGESIRDILAGRPDPYAAVARFGSGPSNPT